jgi:hypothetical protein
VLLASAKSAIGSEPPPATPIEIGLTRDNWALAGIATSATLATSAKTRERFKMAPC